MEDQIKQPFKWRDYNLGLCLIFLFSVQAFYIQSSMILNADVSFLSQMAIYSEGSDFYLQFYEVNPPLIVYIYKLFISIGSFLNINDISALRGGMLIYIFLCSSIILYNFIKIKNGLLLALTLSFCLFFTFPNDFLQREHIITSSFLSYCSMISIRLLGITPSKKVIIANILIIALAISLKPQYAMVFLVSEFYLSYHLKSIKTIFRKENIFILSIGLVYVSFVYLNHNTYFSTVVPLASISYSSYFISIEDLFLLPVILLLVSFLPLRYVYTHSRNSPLLTTVNYLIFIYLSSIATFLVGRTGFSYHLLLSANLTLFFIFLFMYSSIVSLRTKRRFKDIIPLSLAICSLAYLHSMSYYNVLPNSNLSVNHNNIDSLVSIVLDNEENRHLSPLFNSIALSSTPQDKVFAITTTLYPINSIARHSQLQWVNKFPAMWSLPNHVNSDNEESRDVLKLVIESIKNDIVSNSPEIIIIETSKELKRLPPEFSFIDFIKANSVISEELNKYAIFDTIIIRKYRDMEFTIYKRISDE
ncbi:hypothetical protein [Vibrio lentus]|uniref:hypothetical protein n=1 Tax=Vibrio lentus TaxID=136468 RepID=UPI00178CADE8|nr:hypothetical protein [Vibrio lentus]MDN3630198.1 hypothetical protein [Vibrio lentus]